MDLGERKTEAATCGGGRRSAAADLKGETEQFAMGL
jgi:hypothetical protein